tara:strand:+ start:8301 stop:8561 length:261 start_codon:yes stop_codon:yes gene_type:complete
MVNRKIKKSKKSVNKLKGKTKLVKAKTKKRVKKGLKKNNREYIKVSENSKSSKFVEMGNKVQKGEVKWSYYSVDGNVGYHYYLKLT